MTGMRVASLSQPAATLTVTREPCVPCDLGGQHWLPVSDDAVGLHERPMVSRWVTFDYACPEGVVGTRIAIAADEDEPAVGKIGEYEVFTWRGNWRGVTATEGWALYHPDPKVLPAVGVYLPLGVVVGSAIVEASYPIVGPEDTVTPAGSACIVVDSHFLTMWDAPDYWGEANEHDISDQRPFADWSPGRFAWHLTDAEPLPEPVPWVSSGGRLPEWQAT